MANTSKKARKQKGRKGRKNWTNSDRLTAADRRAMNDPWDNESPETQALARARDEHRFDQQAAGDRW